ncbi:Fe-S protein assembly chaperone HscA [Magnetococcales bacterium HHB-1]
MDVLLDIAEPGQSLKPHEESAQRRQRVAGIDLGTTYSLIAAITRDGTPAAIPNSQGNAATASVVHYGQKGEILVGEEAKKRAISHPERTLHSVKRFMGRSAEDIHNQEGQLPYTLEGDQGMVRIRMDDLTVSPVEVSAEILKALKASAEEALGGSLSGVVITVPAYFDDAQRHATKDAGRLAGLEVLRLVNEPTAAALAYGLEKAREGMYAIYDLGGGTFDISILKLTDGVFQVMSTGGDSALGGDDFDRALMDYLLQEMGLSTPSAAQLQRCRQAARACKEKLSNQEITQVMIDDHTIEVSRQLFESRIKPLVRKTGLPCRRAMKDAGINKEDLKGVVLVGGSTRVPYVRQFVQELFGCEPLADLDPDQVVALGAAHQADLLAGNSESDLLLLDVTPLSLGLETMGGLMEKVIPRNSPIPTARAQEFTTFKDGQTAMAIHVLQGERELVDQCRSLARFELRGIPPMTAGAARIQVTFQVDADGLLTVTAQEQTTKVEQTVTVKPSYGLSDEEIETMLRDALEHGESDIKNRWLNEARVDAERVIHAITAALKSDGHLLNEEETSKVEAVITTLKQVINGEDHEKINQAVTQADKDTQFFAQRRMDYNVRKTMKGQRVDTFDAQ